MAFKSQLRRGVGKFFFEECVQLACEEWAYLIRSVCGLELCPPNFEAAHSVEV